MHYLPFPALLKWLTNDYLVIIPACPGTVSLLFFSVRLFSFKKRVNCIVDSTVSSVYETI